MFGDDLLLYAMGTARIENNRDFAAAIAPAVGFDSGLLWRNPLGNLTLEAKGDYFHNGEVRLVWASSSRWSWAATSACA